MHNPMDYTVPDYCGQPFTNSNSWDRERRPAMWGKTPDLRYGEAISPNRRQHAKASR